jgi:hypothetical protein
VTDIITRLRDVIALEGISVPEFRALLAEAATTIERQRATIFTWEAAARFERGSMGMEQPAPDEPATVTEAPTSTPR